MKISKTLSTEQARSKQMKRIKALEEILYQDSIENKQKGKKIKVGIILRIAALQVQGVEGLETVPVGNHF